MGRGEKRVHDNLHAHAQNEPIKNHQKLLGPNHAAHVNMSRTALFSSRSGNKNIFFDADTAAISFFSLCHILLRMLMYFATLCMIFFTRFLFAVRTVYICVILSVFI